MCVIRSLSEQITAERQEKKREKRERDQTERKEHREEKEEIRGAIRGVALRISLDEADIGQDGLPNNQCNSCGYVQNIATARREISVTNHNAEIFQTNNKRF